VPILTLEGITVGQAGEERKGKEKRGRNINAPEAISATDAAFRVLWVAYEWRNQKSNKNSSGDEIANVNFYAVRPEATRIRWNNAK